MLLNVYLIGSLVTAIGVGGALVAANRLSDRRRSRLLSDGSLAVLAGALWPVLVVGVVEMLAIKAVVDTMRAASARRIATTERYCAVDDSEIRATMEAAGA